VCNAYRPCRYFVSWRNVTLDNSPVPDDALARLQQYAIPSSGRLKLHYVSYQVRSCLCRSLHWCVEPRWCAYAHHACCPEGVISCEALTGACHLFLL
jgi:hypothetical protein